ncbi:hypothetical protein AQJ66_26595 [Streptomyces bungoensis]|uniref:Uncharacterized protein n=1 Tax=Streptomyces bungoensis TaxID=285568 RepID=A0A101SUJ6_9ACTN|nr:hypothetical protein [Streptomyces bungoensis]KUN80312.1 hypothetical protein AQJ66_26595 [Streptomyces bungoensis]
MRTGGAAALPALALLAALTAGCAPHDGPSAGATPGKVSPTPSGYAEMLKKVDAAQSAAAAADRDAASDADR